jgi:hypothetical protein
MAKYESVLEKDAQRAFDKLETKKNEMQDAEFAATVIDREIANTKALLESGKLVDADQKYNETTILIERAEASNRAEPLVWRLFWLELGYLILLLLVGYMVRTFPDYWLWAKFISVHSGTAWFGALGGVTIGLFGLYTHIQVRDFDPKYELWYVCKPIMGAIFGWFVFVIFYVGFIAIGTKADLTNPLLLYVIAFLAGFSERFTIRIVDRMMTLLTTWEDKPTGSTTATAQTK